MQKQFNCKGLAKTVCSVFAALFFVVFTSCVSRPPVVSLDPVSVLDPDAAVYMVIPGALHKGFIEKILVSEIAGLDSKDAHRVVSQIDTCWISADFQGNRKSYQVIASGTYPFLVTKSYFTKKNGWTEKIFNGKQSQYTYYVNASEGIEVSLISPSFVCLSNAVTPMLERYDLNMTSLCMNGVWKQDLLAWLNDEGNDGIRFYMQKPSYYTAQFLGKGSSLGIEDLSGVMTENKTKEGLLNLELSVHLSDARTLKAALALLKIALFPVPAKIVPADAVHIMITEITVSENALIDMISR